MSENNINTKEALRNHLNDKYQSVEEHLERKERLMLAYVFQTVPRPYYVSWKQEFNDLFAQMVRLKVRQKTLFPK